MRNLKKTIVLALVALMAVFGVFANGTAETPATEKGKTELVWAVWDIGSTAYYQPIIDAYEAKHPDVTIRMVDLGSADFMTALQTQLASGSSEFDVVTIKDIPGYNNLVKKNMIVNLNDYIAKDKIDTKQYGGTTEQISVNGNLYALPFRSDFWVVFYNKGLFDKAGIQYPTNDMTFAQYDALARKMTSGNGANKVYGCHYHTWRSCVQLFGILDGKHTIIQPPYDYLKPYYEMVLGEQNDGICQNYATLKASSIHYSGQFQNGSIAMMNMGSWYIATQIQKVAAGEADPSKSWGIVKYPHAEGVAPGSTLGTITSLSISQGSKKKDAAWDFVKFVTSPEGAAVVAKTGTIPAIMSNAVVDEIASMPGFPTDGNSKEALHVGKAYLEMPLSDKSGQIETVLNQVHDEIMTYNISVDDGLKKMGEEVQKILDTN
jgi:multiple sugar transport system substrate-binding protein